MADGKTKTETLHKPRDLKTPTHMYPDSQLCVRKTFSPSFVPQPTENRTYHTLLGAMPSRTTQMYNPQSAEYRKTQLITYFLLTQKAISMAKVDM